MLADHGRARRWTLPLNRLDDQVDRLVIWEPAGLDAEEQQALEEWVSAGHVALLGGPIAGLAAEMTTAPGERARSVAVHAVNLSIAEVSVGGDRFAAHPREGLIHLKDDAGHPVLISWGVGAGRIFWSADTEWLTNWRIARAQNLDLALQILLPAEGRLVAFDEYHHGFQSATRWWQILRGPLQLFLLLLAAAVAILFWAYGARFGSPRPSPPAPPRAAVEYVYSMSQLYRRAGARGVVLQALHRSLTTGLGRLLGGIRGLTHGEIARRTAHRTGLPPEQIEGLLNRTAPEQTTLPAEAELIKLARETEELQRRMQNAGYRDQRDPRTSPD